MAEAPVISVVTPIHRLSPRFEEVRSSVHAAASPHEHIIVLNDESLSGSVRAGHPSDRILVCPRKGRGFALARGIADARGGAVLLLHADTLLPSGWDTAILRSLSDPRVVGGGFRMRFDRPTAFLRFISRFSEFLDSAGGAMWGDRAVFARAEDLRECLPALDVPLFEDVRLSKALRRRGRLALLDATVVTSAEHFHRNGPFRQTLRILKARAWYAAGGDPQRIYDYYYSR
jgi:glycosyltransferase involved in cell wall biosynthesis